MTKSRFHPLLRLMRPHQWIKNAFLFTGVVFAHAWDDHALVIRVVAAAAAFSLVSSCVYIFNDWMDRDADRLHPEKRHRPLASGEVGAGRALLFGIVLLASGVSLGYWASRTVASLLFIYVIMNVAYTVRLKHVVLLDVFIISAGFMLRILAGTVGFDLEPSQWLLLCGLMLTLFLGFTKRRAEINACTNLHAGKRGNESRGVTNYTLTLLDQMIGITATGVIVSYSLYTMSSDTILLHGTSNLIYTVPILVYGIFRYIYLVHDRDMGSDVARDLFRDLQLLMVIIGWIAATLWLIA